MKQLSRNKPITKAKYAKIFFYLIIGIWFVTPILILRPFKKIYFAPLQSSRIGHFILDTEILLARVHADQVNRRKKIFVIWVPDSYICNYYVYNIWKQKISIVPYNVVTSAILLTAVYLEKIIKIKITYRFIGWDGYLPYQQLLENTPAIFGMPEEDEKECIKALQLNGVDISKQWVCILGRDNGYLNATQPNLSWDFNSYRNSNIETYKDAAEYLASKNILVFRMGTHVDKPFMSNNSKLIIDYANSGWRTEKLDIFLSVKCLFFISSSTGLDSVRHAIRKPVVIVNLAQPLTLIKYKEDHFFIVKKFFHKKTNKFLSVKQFYELGSIDGFTVDNPRHLRTQDFERLGIDVIDNTASEIKDVTVEMYEFLAKKNGNVIQLSEKQVEFWEKFPNIFGFDESTPFLSRIGKRFIDQNPWLLD